MATDMSYVRGRLEGLFELVTLLKDMVHGDVSGSAEMLQKMVDHVYTELGEILDIMGSSVAPHVERSAAPVAHKVAEAKSESKGPVKAKDVLSELLTNNE